MRQLNLVFLAVLVAGLALFGGGLHLVHGFQMRRNASALLDRARRAEADKKLDKAEEALRWYLSLRPDDGPTWARYARIVDDGDPGRRRLEHVFLVHEEALRHNTGDRDLKRRCIDLAMEMGRFGDARPMLSELLDAARGAERAEGPAGAGPGPDAAAVERAELEDLTGRCERELGDRESAEKWFRAAIEHDPTRVDAYDRLARLLQTELRRDDRAAETVRDMVDRNPGSGRARAYRWRFAREFAPPADAADLAKALELAPDDREVLIAAIMESERKQDMAAMRAHLEKGHRLGPKDVSFALGLSRLETREGRLDRAEDVLRRAFEARPVVALAFELADVLVQEVKIDGKDSAAELMALLRRAGLGETLVRFLEAESLVRQKQWAEAVRALENARATLSAAPELVLRLNLMLAECHGRLGAEEQRLDALRRASESNEGGDAVRATLASALARAGRLDQAIAALSPLASSGGGPEWRLDLARLLLQKTARQPRERRDWPAVERALGAAEKAMPEGADAEPVVLLRLDVLAAQDRLDEARKLLDRALAKGPRNLSYRLALARLTQLQGRNDEALSIIDRAEKDLGPGPRIDLARLDHWGRRGGAAAVAALEKLSEKRGEAPAADRPALLDRLQSVAIQLGRPDLARQYGRELAELQPDNVPIRLRLFDLALMAGDRDGAARLVAEARAIEGDEGTNWRFAQAALLIDQARRGQAVDLDEARRLAAEIAERTPSSWIGPTLNGEIAELAGSTDQAVDHYLQALELGNTQPSFARRLVMLLNRKGRHADVDRVTRALHDQGTALAEITLAQALDALRNRDYDRSITLARQVFSESSTGSADHLNLGRFYLAAGRTAEAGKEFLRAVELGRGVPENWLAYVEYLAQAKRPDEAKAAIESARQALPADQATITLARCALLVGDTARAEALVKQALDAEGKSDDPDALRLAIDVNLRLKRLDAARSCLDRVAASPAATPGDRAWANRTRAALLLATGRLTDREQALTLINANLAKDSENVEDQSLKATILTLWPARRGEAVAILERLAGTNRLGDDQRFLLARLYLGRGEEPRYQDQMQKLLATKARGPRHLAHFVNYWIDRRQFDQADHWLAELKKDDPKGLPALELEARLLDARKRRTELLALLEARAREVPDEVGAVADLLNHYGFATEAESAYRAFIARGPKQPERPLALARFLARRDRIAEAAPIFREAWKDCNHKVVAAASLVIYASDQAGERERSEVGRWLEQAVAEAPEDPALSAMLGGVMIQEGRFDEAEQLSRRALSADPVNPEALNNLAWMLSLQDANRSLEALELINRAIERHGDNSSLLDTRGVVLIRAGQVDRAIKELEAARDRNPRSRAVALHLAWAYETVGRIEEARRSFRRALELGFKADRADPLERPFVTRLQQKLERNGPSYPTANQY